MEAVGLALANAVATALEQGTVVAYGHRDYCGMGLRYHAGVFIYDEAQDGEVPSDDDLQYWHASPSRQRQTFASRAAFVGWLAQQTDRSLAGTEWQGVQPWLVDNQRLTLERLRAAGAAGAPG